MMLSEPIQANVATGNIGGDFSWMLPRELNTSDGTQVDYFAADLSLQSLGQGGQPSIYRIMATNVPLTARK